MATNISRFLIVFALVFATMYFFTSTQTTNSVISAGQDTGIVIYYHGEHCPAKLAANGGCRSTPPFRIGEASFGGGVSFDGTCGAHLRGDFINSPEHKELVGEISIALNRLQRSQDEVIQELKTQEEEALANNELPLRDSLLAAELRIDKLSPAEYQASIAEDSANLQKSLDSANEAALWVTDPSCFNVGGLKDEEPEKYVAFNKDNTIGYLKVQYLGCHGCEYGFNTQGVPITVTKEVPVDANGDGIQDVNSFGKPVTRTETQTVERTDSFFNSKGTITTTVAEVMDKGNAEDSTVDDHFYTYDMKFTFKCAVLNPNGASVNKTSGCENMGFINGIPLDFHKDLIGVPKNITYKVDWELYGKKDDADYLKFQTTDVSKGYVVPGGVIQHREDMNLVLSNVFGDSQSNTATQRAFADETLTYKKNLYLGDNLFTIPERTDNYGYINQTLQPFFTVFNGWDKIQINDDEYDLADYVVGAQSVIKIRPEYDCSDGKTCPTGTVCQDGKFESQTFRVCALTAPGQTTAIREASVIPTARGANSSLITGTSTGLSGQNMVLIALAIASGLVLLFKKQLITIIG